MTGAFACRLHGFGLPVCVHFGSPRLCVPSMFDSLGVKVPLDNLMEVKS